MARSRPGRQTRPPPRTWLNPMVHWKLDSFRNHIFIKPGGGLRGFNSIHRIITAFALCVVGPIVLYLYKTMRSDWVFTQSGASEGPKAPSEWWMLRKHENTTAQFTRVAIYTFCSNSSQTERILVNFFIDRSCDLFAPFGFILASVL